MEDESVLFVGRLFFLRLFLRASREMCAYITLCVPAFCILEDEGNSNVVT